MAYVNHSRRRGGGEERSLGRGVLSGELPQLGERDGTTLLHVAFYLLLLVDVRNIALVCLLDNYLVITQRQKRPKKHEKSNDVK